ncbi:hypothetical protein BJV85_003276 [Clostridium acetobutylicum]|uniref:Predicted membrane protein n=1 Tax=Clostridium acetobutylicum (strain ATCC 824 / DSM 792 / JCM 1419 / IAM 19013 / LMG 5710 / NBRC 13948 / NRRL B-527 / VKM B-1787 / 2291 / W) TaxID=272562 RepID=Q97L33_CLOAB|nr:MULTISPECIES: DUF2194 domain-containing protein [Clostridium]AAK78709.1 Predicted membrane protein [Clostridium acetobutylicum ATCC 824]ADZ19783.1 membrane protein [Clostridium acetobutylicum EA 2018]AEI31401.1 hypothetical protein SMB_G0749 [Clostridium acetobutylicum DSM 1731]AWV80428.1 DUF2194 domain-containing protein [Clostridium acetobutylicum]MBC2392618.1 DUF2194 domain-containing protein [Clostridium acetobutylicum]
MNIKRNIRIMLTIVLCIAVFFQILRLNFVMNFFKNDKGITNKISYTSAKIPSNTEKEKFLILFDKNEQNSSEIKNNIEQMLKYMKKTAVVEEKNNVQTVDPSYRAVILTFEDIDDFKSLSSVMNYAQNGGNVLFAERPVMGDALSSISNEIGIKTVSDMGESDGMTLLSNVLIKGNGVNVSKDIVSDYSLKVTLNNNSKLLGISDNKIPMMWQTKFGSGNIMVFNGTILAKKDQRGIITGAISLLVPNYIYPIIDAKLTYIDDFPAPIPSGYNSSIYKEYGITTADFYRKVWWPDVLKGSRLYNLKYTGSIIEDYNNNTTPPFSTKTSNANDFILYGSELVKSGGELGIHGYNHQSLAPKDYIKEPLGYKPWASEENMVKAVEEVSRYSASLFKNYAFKVYVPPSNVLSPDGKKAILKAMPNLKTISSIYTDDYYKDTYVQEFEIKNGICELPRITSGYYDDEETIWKAYNGLTSVGVFSHFIHPDDILDAKRSQGKNWEQLLKNYNSLMYNIYKKFPWLTASTASEASNSEKSYSDLEPFIKYNKDSIDIYCKNFEKGDKFIFRSNKDIYSDGSCEIEKIDTGVYLITANKEKFSINIK